MVGIVEWKINLMKLDQIIKDNFCARRAEKGGYIFSKN